MRSVQITKLFNFFLHPTTFFWVAVLITIGSKRYLYLLDQARDPSGFLIGIILGILLYYGAIAIVSSSLPNVGRYVKEVGRILGHNRSPVSKMIILGGRSVYEEAFWRGTVQVLLGNNFSALLLTALLFTGRHIYLYRGIRRLSSSLVIELFTFSLCLGVIYFLMNRILLVVAIHFIRNVLITAECTVPARKTETMSSDEVQLDTLSRSRDV